MDLISICSGDPMAGRAPSWPPNCPSFPMSCLSGICIGLEAGSPDVDPKFPVLSEAPGLRMLIWSCNAFALGESLA